MPASAASAEGLHGRPEHRRSQRGTGARQRRRCEFHRGIFCEASSPCRRAGEIVCQRQLKDVINHFLTIELISRHSPWLQAFPAAVVTAVHGSELRCATLQLVASSLRPVALSGHLQCRPPHPAPAKETASFAPLLDLGVELRQDRQQRRPDALQLLEVGERQALQDLLGFRRQFDQNTASIGRVVATHDQTLLG